MTGFSESFFAKTLSLFIIIITVIIIIILGGGRGKSLQVTWLLWYFTYQPRLFSPLFFHKIKVEHFALGVAIISYLRYLACRWVSNCLVHMKSRWLPQMVSAWSWQSYEKIGIYLILTQLSTATGIYDCLEARKQESLQDQISFSIFYLSY